MIYSRLTVLMVVMYIAPAWAGADVLLPNASMSSEAGYAVLASNERNSRANPSSGKQQLPPPEPKGGMSAPPRNLPHGHNRGFGYGFERRHAQPGPISAPVSLPF